MNRNKFTVTVKTASERQISIRSASSCWQLAKEDIFMRCRSDTCICIDQEYITSATKVFAIKVISKYFADLLTDTLVLVLRTTWIMKCTGGFFVSPL